MTNIVALQQPDPEPVPAWDDFWTIYPRHVARKDAQKAWSRLAPAEQAAAIIGAAVWRPIWLRRGQPEYIPHPATFLNGARWEDEPPAQVTVSSSAHVPFATGAALPARTGLPDSVREMLKRLRAGK